ncbi:MAG TPA: glutamine--fructose-6-phosphate transaminase (isomerizing) [Candidatus Nanoarchaeia archaeon]|nr:glutamine--fructose-6-phosphate transaminase (isomerizing) [Candidatus Nanoarchaeia archaeon]
MCGIYGYIGKRNAAPILLEGIKKLEYRGYDSVGMATQSNNQFYIKKDIGAVQEVHKKVNFLDMPGTMGIVHTRWSTHGGVTKANAHPHLSCKGKVVVIHNGIIENYEELKKDLQNKGCKFISETDSEVISHYFEQKLASGKEISEVVKDFIREAKGTFAILMMIKGDDKIYAMRRDSPLVLGIGNGENYIASDIYAFSDKTDKAIFFDNDEYAVITPQRYQFFSNEKELKKEIKQFVWEKTVEEKKQYGHYMLKEIMEEPTVVKRLLLSLKTDQKEIFTKLVSLIKNSHKVVFVASGTSYHATLIGCYYLHKQHVEAQTLIASEFEHFATIEKDTLVIAFSQSGETMDVIDALKYAKSKGAKIAAAVNVPYSTIQRMSDLSLNILAGQEICVAATKSFVNQVALLLRVAEQFGYDTDIKELPEKIEAVLSKASVIKAIAEKIYKHRDIYVIGRALGYPVAREIALKIKEVSYIHAEGMMGGELKHGTIALIEQGTPVISLMINHDAAMASNAKEVEARGASVITIGTEQGDILVPTHNDGTFAILASIVGQLFAYYLAVARGNNPDRPRNLAKAVTVR